MFHRSTKSVVQGSRLEQAIRREPGSIKDTPEMLEPEATQLPGKPKICQDGNHTRNRLIPAVCGLGIALLLGAGIFLMQEMAAAPKAHIPEGQMLLEVPTGLGNQAEAGDVLRLYAAGDAIASMRYVPVQSASDDGVTVRVTEQQMLDYLTAAETGTVTPALVIHSAPEAAQTALELQAAWNDPEISMDLPEHLELAVGDSTGLEVQVTAVPEGANVPEISYCSSDPGVADTADDGTVTANAPGEAKITVRCGGQEAICTVKALLAAEKLEFESKSITLAVGGNAAPALTVSPSDYTEQFVWSSSDESVAKVNEDGSVTGIAPGEAEIRVSGKESSASYLVTVVTEAEQIRLSRETLLLEAGSSGALAAVVTPEDASDKTVTWTSSDEAVATVDAEGTVMAIAEGKTTITASCGSVSAACPVTVLAPAATPTP